MTNLPFTFFSFIFLRERLSNLNLKSEEKNPLKLRIIFLKFKQTKKFIGITQKKMFKYAIKSK